MYVSIAPVNLERISPPSSNTSTEIGRVSRNRLAFDSTSRVLCMIRYIGFITRYSPAWAERGEDGEVKEDGDDGDDGGRGRAVGAGRSSSGLQRSLKACSFFFSFSFSSLLDGDGDGDGPVVVGLNLPGLLPKKS